MNSNQDDFVLSDCAVLNEIYKKDEKNDTLYIRFEVST